MNTSKEQLRTLLARVDAAHELEKTRLARTLHDDLSQKLTALLIELSLLEASFSRGSKEAQKLTELSAIVASISQSVRRLTNELRLKILDEFGLPAAIQHEAQRLAKDKNIHLIIKPKDEDLTICGEPAALAFKILQKVVSQMSAQHGATEICVQTEQSPTCFWLRVSENTNGRGREKLFSSDPIAVVDLREDVRRLAGKLKILEIPGGGSVVTLKVPTQPAAKRARRSAG